MKSEQIGLINTKMQDRQIISKDTGYINQRKTKLTQI